jgi:hypothetical protein
VNCGCIVKVVNSKTGYRIRSYIRAVLINVKDSRTTGLMQINGSGERYIFTVRSFVTILPLNLRTWLIETNFVRSSRSLFEHREVRYITGPGRQQASTLTDSQVCTIRTTTPYQKFFNHQARGAR